MGTWGPGVFESDSAWDMRAFFGSKLVEHIESCLYRMIRDAKGYHQKWGIDSFLAALSMFHLLVLEIKLAPPEPNEVRHWRKEFLSGWKEILSANELSDDDKDYFEKRRLAVHNTFDSLIEMADNYRTSKPEPYIHTWKWQPILLEGNKHNVHFIRNQLNILQLCIQSTLYDFENDKDWWLNNNYDDEEVLAAVYILRLLQEKCDCRPTEEAIVNGWKEKYLTQFTSEYDEEGKQSEYYLKRIEVIEETFDDLIYLSRNWIPHHQRKPKSP